MRLGAIEAGGTKMVVGILDENLKILSSQTFPTRSPEETLPDLIGFFERKKINALGIGSFGPVDVHQNSPTYGQILATPKLQWQNYPLLQTLKEALQVPCALDTDVNVAALCEQRIGAGKGMDNVLYLTVGTGIGGGLIINGQPVHGALHPEWGHIGLQKMANDPLKKSVCPYHDSCGEGLASGPAIKERWGMPAQDLPDNHPAWALEAEYLAQICATALYTVSPEKIILGGGVMYHTALYPMIRKLVKEKINNYLSSPVIDDWDNLIIPPQFYPESGLYGAGILAQESL